MHASHDTLRSEMQDNTVSWDAVESLGEARRGIVELAGKVDSQIKGLHHRLDENLPPTPNLQTNSKTSLESLRAELSGIAGGFHSTPAGSQNSNIEGDPELGNRIARAAERLQEMITSSSSPSASVKSSQQI